MSWVAIGKALPYIASLVKSLRGILDKVWRKYDENSRIIDYTDSVNRVFDKPKTSDDEQGSESDIK